MIFSKKAVILYVTLGAIIFSIWGALINRLLRFKAAESVAYIHKEFLEIDSLKHITVNIDTIKIHLGNEETISMEKTRKAVLNTFFKTGEMNIKKHSYHQSFTEYKNYISSSNMKLFGMNSDHYHKNKPSYRVKFNGGKFFAKKKINLLSPKTRSFQMDHIYNQTYKNKFGGIGINQTPVFLVVNNKSHGIYFMEDFFDKYLIEKNKKKESFIFESGFNDKFHGSKPISKLNTDDGYFHINTLPKGKKWKNLSKRVIDLFHNNDPNQLFSIINAEKLNAVIGLCLFAQDHHPLLDINLHWYYNPSSNKLEPLIRESYIHKIPKNYSIDAIWEEFQKKITKDPAVKLIKEWIIYQGEGTAKRIITQNALESALYIKEYINNDYYKSFTSKLNTDFSYNIAKKEVIINHNIAQIISKINLIDINPLTYDSTIVITNNMIIDNDLLIEKNMSLAINPGVEITLKDNANIYLYGNISVLGNSSNPIKFTGDKNSNSSIYINSSSKGLFNFCEFANLSALNNNLKIPLFKDMWETSSSITIYESSNISFNNCLFYNNKNGDDMINVVRCDLIKFNNCSFKNVLSDALDSDFSNIIIESCTFNLVGNDAVDGSDSNISIKKSYFKAIADKAISVGEASSLNMINCTITDSEIALVVKDGSLLEAKNVLLNNNKMDLVAFTKKQEYNPPSFKLLNCYIETYLIDKESRNIGNGDYYRTSLSIKDILYGNQYGKASIKK
jgi:hypothetical protein